MIKDLKNSCLVSSYMTLWSLHIQHVNIFDHIHFTCGAGLGQEGRAVVILIQSLFLAVLFLLLLLFLLWNDSWLFRGILRFYHALTLEYIFFILNFNINNYN